MKLAAWWRELKNINERVFKEKEQVLKDVDPLADGDARLARELIVPRINRGGYGLAEQARLVKVVFF
jgi:hypothetical protein